MIRAMTDMFRLLEAEWTMHLAHDPAARAQLAEVLDAVGARTLGDLEAHVRAAAPAEADRVLLALVRRAVAGDDLAARVLLQLLLPGARSLARRWWALGDHHERAAATVLAVYHRIRTYPVERRPGRVAANILMDAATELRRGVPRVAEVPTADPRDHQRAEAGGEEAGGHAALELAEVLADAVADGTLAAADAQLIARSRIAGDRIGDIAHHRGLQPRTLWDRRQRAERTLVATRRALHPADAHLCRSARTVSCAHEA
jgi:hypothetical protein